MTCCGSVTWTMPERSRTEPRSTPAALSWRTASPRYSAIPPAWRAPAATGTHRGSGQRCPFRGRASVGGVARQRRVHRVPPELPGADTARHRQDRCRLRRRAPRHRDGRSGVALLTGTIPAGSGRPEQPGQHRLARRPLHLAGSDRQSRSGAPHDCGQPGISVPRGSPIAAGQPSSDASASTSRLPLPPDSTAPSMYALQVFAVSVADHLIGPIRAASADPKCVQANGPM